MVSFEYNPLADSVTVKHECPKCHHVNVDTFGVPAPNMLAETHHESINQDFSDAICEKCDAEYNVILTNGFYGGYGEIEDVETILDVDEDIPGEDEDFYDKQLYDATHTDIEKMLDASTALAEDIKPMLYKLLYANAITMMETYLGDTLKREVLKDEASMRRFVENYKPFKEIEIKLSDLYLKRDNLPQYIRETLNSILFHDLRKVKPIYKDVLNIDLGDVRELYRAVLVRHDIVHRNGFDKEKNEHEITKNDVQKLLDKVQNLIEQVDKSLISRQETVSEATILDAAERSLFPFDM